MKHAPHTTPEGFWIKLAVAFAMLTIAVVSPPVIQVVGAVIAVAVTYTAMRSWQELNGTIVIATTSTPGVHWLGAACTIVVAGLLAASLTANVVVALVAAAAILGAFPVLGARFDRDSLAGA